MLRSRVGAAILLATLATALLLPARPGLSQTAPPPPEAPSLEAERRVEPIILQGANLPGWSRSPAQGAGNPYPSGSSTGDGVRDAHNGNLFVAPDPEGVIGKLPENIAAFRWTGSVYEEIPVQVDQRFPYFLANANSDFSPYSGTDEELTYQWDIESWKKIYGDCFARYPNADEKDPSNLKGLPTQDPVRRLDDDDEVVFMRSDAGLQAPSAQTPPTGAGLERQEIRLSDPLTGEQSFVYLFTRPGGTTFDKDNGYVKFERGEDADAWLDRSSFSEDDPEELGTSNTGYGPNLSGTVCTTHDQATDTYVTDPATKRASTDRFPRDNTTVTTASYEWRSSGRWMVRSMKVAKADHPSLPPVYGQDLIDRWKGRAFQQSPDSDVSLVGFEDEQVNWEANSALLGERMGPVRAIREVWGADSGTNVTKREYFYRDLIVNRYFLRVHPIPPDGLYTSWDHNHDTVATYYNESRPNGVPVDGQNDDAGQIDSTPFGLNAYFDATDPTFSKPLAIYNWEQVAGREDNGSLVYMFQLNNAQSAANPAIIPYYRDDACFDDGTGDDPSPRPEPGDSQASIEGYSERPCYGDKDEFGEVKPGPYKQGCFGCHGIHFLATHDTDNGSVPKPVTEVDGQQYQWAAPTVTPSNVGDRYANTVKFATLPVATPQNVGGTPDSTTTTTSSTTTTTMPGGSTTTSTTVPGGSTTTSSTTSTSVPVEDEEGEAGTTIQTSHKRVAFYGSFNLSGKVTGTNGCAAPYEVSIFKQAFGGNFYRYKGTTGTDEDGAWSLPLSSRVSAHYVAKVEDQPTCSGSFSRPVAVKAHADVRVGALPGKRCEGSYVVRGGVQPEYPGTHVYLSRPDGGKTLDKDELDKNSRYRLRVPGCRGTFQVTWPSQSQRNLKGSITFER